MAANATTIEDVVVRLAAENAEKVQAILAGADKEVQKIIRSEEQLAKGPKNAGLRQVWVNKQITALKTLEAQLKNIDNLYRETQMLAERGAVASKLAGNIGELTTPRGAERARSEREIAQQRKEFREEFVSNKDMLSSAVLGKMPPTSAILEAQKALLNFSSMRADVVRSMASVEGELAKNGLSYERSSGLIRQYNALSGQLEQVNGQINRSSEFIEKFKKKATLDGRIQAQWDKFKTVFVRVADALISFLIINNVAMGIQAFAKSLIASNAELEVLDARLTLMTKDGGSFDALRKEIITLTVSTPFIIKDFIDASVSLQAFGLSAGKYLSPIADWASALGRDINDVALAFSKISAHSPRTSLLLSTRGINKADFDREYSKTLNAATALTNIIERKFGGMAERVSGTFKGILSNVQDVWFLITSVIGKDTFLALKSDVSAFFETMKSQISEPSAMLTVLSKAFLGVYESIKMVIYGMLALGAIKLFSFFNSTTESLKMLSSGLFETVRHSSGFGMALTTIKGKLVEFISSSYGFALAIGVVVTGLMDAYAAGKNVEKSFKDSSDALAKYGRDSDSYLYALDKEKESLIEATSLWIQYWEAFKGVWKTSGADPLGETNRRFERIDQIKEETQSVKELMAATKSLTVARGEESSFLEIFNLSKGTGKRSEFKKSLADIRKNIEKEVTTGLFSRFVGGDSQKILQDRLTKLGLSAAFTTGTGLSAAFATGADVRPSHSAQDLSSALSFLEVVRALELPTEALRKKRFDEIMHSIGDSFEYAAQKGSTAVQKIGELKELLGTDEAQKKVKKPLVKKPPKGRTLSVRLEEIARARAELDALREGEPNYLARIAGNKAKISKYDELGVLTAAQTLDYLRSQIDVLKDQASYDDKISTLNARKLELADGLVSAQSELNQSQLEYAQSLTGDYDVLRDSLKTELLRLEAQSKELENRIYIKYLDGQGKENGIERKQREIEIAGLTKEQLEAYKAILEIKKKLRDLPSESFGDAFNKLAAKLKESAKHFFDEMASTLYEEVKGFGTGILKDMLFGNDERNKIQDQIGDLHTQLVQLNEERNRQTNAANKIRRIDGETNDEYLRRIAFQQQLQSSSVDMYTYQTKEMEIAQKINELEQQRNNIIIERLRSLGEKVVDKLLDKALDVVFGGVFGGIFGGGKPSFNYSGSPDGERPYIAPPRGSSGVGGSNINLHFHAPVYGMQDFNQQVEVAINKYNGRRVA